jgi:hypothetical protein
MKKGIFILVVAIIVVGGAFAQTQKNWISGEVGLLGAGIRYERMLNDKFSIGGTYIVNYIPILDIEYVFGGEVATRFYPWAGKFYAEFGLGYGSVKGYETKNTKPIKYNGKEVDPSVTLLASYNISGLLVAPGIGWKIDVGKPGKFFINPMISVLNVLGKQEYAFENLFADAMSGKFKVGTTFRVAFGVGGSF